MPRCIVKLKEDTYVEWSTIVDAPVTYILTRKEMLKYLDERYGTVSFEENRERLDRTDKNGTSFHEMTHAEELICSNRAGENEEKITLEQILERYDYGKNQEVRSD